MLIDEMFPQVVGGYSTLHAQFESHALANGVVDAEHLFGLLPRALRKAPCFFDRLTDRWRYEFGKPWTTRRIRVFGPHVWPLVDVLVGAAVLLDKHVHGKDRARWLARLGDPRKHDIAIAEMMPVKRVPPDVTIEYEAPTGEGGHTVDWLLRRSTQLVFVEVKRRSVDMISLAGEVSRGRRRSGNRAPQPQHDAELMLRSIMQKFSPSSNRLQGAWIATGLQQETTELDAAFRSLDPDRIQFLVLGGWELGVTVLARSAEQSACVIELLGQRATDGFVFERANDDSERWKTWTSPWLRGTE